MRFAIMVSRARSWCASCGLSRERKWRGMGGVKRAAQIGVEAGINGKKSPTSCKQAEGWCAFSREHCRVCGWAATGGMQEKKDRWSWLQLEGHDSCDGDFLLGSSLVRWAGRKQTELGWIENLARRWRSTAQQHRAPQHHSTTAPRGWK